MEGEKGYLEMSVASPNSVSGGSLRLPRCVQLFANIGGDIGNTKR